MSFVERLGEFPFFAHMKRGERESFLKPLKSQTHKVGDRILKQGDTCRTAHLLMEGSVDVSTRSRDGREAHIMLHRAPSLFGIIELWREAPHLGDVVAQEPCTTVLVPRPHFLKLLHSDHQLCINILQFLSDQIYQNGMDHRIRIFGTAGHVLARYLWNHGNAFGEPVQKGVLLRQSLNKSVLARTLGLSRRQIIREFSELEDAGLVEVQKQMWLIPDLEKLRARAESDWRERRANVRSEEFP